MNMTKFLNAYLKNYWVRDASFVRRVDQTLVNVPEKNLV